MIGLALSLWIHIAALFGRQVMPDPFLFIMHLGIFVVWIPAMFVFSRLARAYNRRDIWKAALRGSPDWLRYSIYIFDGYGLVRFFVPFTQSQHRGGSPALTGWEEFSAIWIIFYATAFGVFLSVANSEQKSLELE